MLSGHNFVNADTTNTKGVPERLLGFAQSVASANFNNLRFGQLGKSMRRPAKDFVSALCDHVVGVFFVGSKEKVVGVDASPIVAFVADAQPVGYRAVMNKPRKTMGRNKLSECKQPIPSAVCADPVPAGVRFLNFRPKASNKFWFEIFWDGVKLMLIHRKLTFSYVFESVGLISRAFFLRLYQTIYPNKRTL